MADEIVEISEKNYSTILMWLLRFMEIYILMIVKYD